MGAEQGAVTCALVVQCAAIFTVQLLQLTIFPHHGELPAPLSALQKVD